MMKTGETIAARETDSGSMVKHYMVISNTRENSKEESTAARREAVSGQTSTSKGVYFSSSFTPSPSESNLDRWNDSLSTEPFTCADKASQCAWQLASVQHDGISPVNNYAYMELSPRRDSAQAEANITVVVVCRASGESRR